MSDQEKSNQQSNGSPKYWFSAKKHGWGWGFPTCWQGWLVMLGTFTVMLGALLLIDYLRAPFPFILLAIIVPCIALVAACVLKGPPPKWRFGDDGTDA
ncbi:MAG: hypothetical protein R3E58_03580 [Phycisphaerae bacterium]|nr:hypothetical protein [Phycisphaerales bacterium]